MRIDLANAGLIRHDNVQIRLLTDYDTNQRVPEPDVQDVPDQNVVQNDMEQESDQIVPEIQNHEQNKKRPKQRKTKKKNFGNKPKKRNQRDYRKFPAIRVPEQPQEDANIPYIPLDDMDPAEPVEDNPLPLKGEKILSEVWPNHIFGKIIVR